MAASGAALRRGDMLLLAAYALLLGGFALVFDRSLTIHETVGCVNVREMLQDGDWVVPHYGGRPWLERPPLPFWLTASAVRLLGEHDWAYRVPPMLVGMGCVLATAWLAAGWFGRGVGIAAGLALATIAEFAHYAAAPECDIFLCGIVTAALALFARLEFRLRPAAGESRGLLGPRPWTLLAFCAVCGAANLVKGLYFGNAMILLPAGAFLLAGADRWTAVRRYLWLPGALAFAAGFGWAFAVWLRLPDVVELWGSDYGGRMNQGYMKEPWWYYAAHLPWLLFPWTIGAGMGLAATWRQALAGRTPERLLWCWALLPAALLSIPQGKHHHYLLHTTPAWAMLAAVGTARGWETLRAWSRGLPGLGAAGAVGLAVAAAALGSQHLIGRWLWWGAAAWLLAALASWQVFRQRDWRIGLGMLFALLLPSHWLAHAALPLLADRYAADRAFAADVLRRCGPDDALLALDGRGPLDASWMLHYLGGRAKLLHNPTFLLDETLPREVLVVARRGEAARLAEFGGAELLAESAHSRDEAFGAEQRHGLYRLTFRPDLPRCAANVRISPLQATGRREGPFLGGRGVEHIAGKP